MGVAAYNRGTKAIQDQIDREAPDPSAQVLARLNAIPKRDGAFRPFGAGVIRLAWDKSWHLMNRRTDGWSSYSYRYSTLDALMADWDIRLDGFGKDAFSFFYSFA